MHVFVCVQIALLLLYLTEFISFHIHSGFCTSLLLSLTVTNNPDAIVGGPNDITIQQVSLISKHWKLLERTNDSEMKNTYYVHVYYSCIHVRVHTRVHMYMYMCACI